MPIPVMLMARELNLGGSERQMTEMARGLDRAVFTPHVGCFRAGGLRGDELRENGIPVAQFPVHSLKSSAAITGARQMIRYVRDNGIQLIHTFDYPMNVFGMPVARYFTEAAAVSSQRAHRELTPGIYGRIQRATDRFVDGIVVNCDFLKRHLVKDYAVPENRIHLCYNGIDFDSFHPDGPSVRGTAVANDLLLIGVVCALRPEKGLPTLVEAFAKVQDLDPRLRLAVVGSGPMLEPLQEQARKLGIFERCIWQPGTRQVAEWLRAIDIFVLPSLTEALSNSLMEAMACRCCAIASNVGGNPELVATGERGLLFERENADSLAVALSSVIRDSGLRNRFAANGSQFLHERFSLSVAARRMGEIYLNILKDRKLRHGR